MYIEERSQLSKENFVSEIKLTQKSVMSENPLVLTPCDRQHQKKK